MEYSREKETVKRGQYIKEGMEQIHRTGDSYTYEDDLFLVCKEENYWVNRETFRSDLRYLVGEDYLHIDGRRIYTKKIWRYQEAVVAHLMDMLPSNRVPAVVLPDPLVTSLVALTAEQRTAVEMALSHRISMILGGAGTGKSTLVTALSEHRPHKGGGVLSAPTGKAARNLTHRTRRQAYTVHSALGMRPDQNFLKDIEWACTELVVVDEASMMTLEMLAGILSCVPAECRVVLIGDPNQLLSVGAGNIMNDLLELGVPYVRLNICHRQREETALRNNVSHFAMYSRESELHYDESFRLIELPEEEVPLRYKRRR